MYEKTLIIFFLFISFDSFSTYKENEFLYKAFSFDKTQYKDLKGQKINAPKRSLTPLVWNDSYCLNYKMPSSEDKKGELYLIKNLKNCYDQKVKKVFSLKINPVSLEIKNESILIKESSDKPIFRFSIQQRLSGVYFSESKETRFMGEKTDRFSLGNVKACQVLSDECDLLPSQCHKCRWGFFEVAGKCLNKTEKYCGLDRCGEKNEPACLTNLQVKNPCEDGSKRGFCHKGLEVYCVNKELVCL